MTIWKKNNLRLLKEEQELSDSSIFDEGLWQELIVGSELELEQKPTAIRPGEDPFAPPTFNSSTPPTTTTRGRSKLGLTPVEQQRMTRPKPSTPTTTTTRGRSKLGLTPVEQQRMLRRQKTKPKGELTQEQKPTAIRPGPSLFDPLTFD